MKKLMDFVDEMEFERLGVFTYSPEEDTPAASMPDQIPEEVKEERQSMRSWSFSRISPLTKPKTWIGEELLVMIEGKVADENAYVGRTYRDAPECRRTIFLSTHRKILMSGDFVKV